MNSAGMAVATVDAQDRLLTYGDLTFAHNDHGQRTERRDGDEVTTYDCDELGNLLEVVLPDDTRVTYEVDPRGRRVLEQVDGVTRRGFLYQDGLNPVAEVDASGAITSVFLYASRPHVPDLIVRDGATYRVVADRLGSVRRVVDATTGAVAQAIDYDSYGRVLRDSAPGFQPFAYAGGLYDPDTGLVRFGARDYDAEVGRWTAKDPILFGGGDANIFAFALGDPINGHDPAGLFYVKIGVVGELGLGPRAGSGVGFYFGFDAEGRFDVGVYEEATAGVGAIAAAGVGVAGALSFMNNTDSLTGRSSTIGFSTPSVGACFEEGVVGVSVGPTFGGGVYGGETRSYHRSFRFGSRQTFQEAHSERVLESFAARYNASRRNADD